MQNQVATFAATPDPTFGQPLPTARPEKVKPPEAQAPTPDQADLRLVIEEGKDGGSYVYKTVDRRTGEVILQLPRESILEMRDDVQYVAGAVIRARA